MKHRDVPDIAASDSKVCVGAASAQIAQSVLVVGDGIKGKTVSVSVCVRGNCKRWDVLLSDTWINKVHVGSWTCHIPGSKSTVLFFPALVLSLQMIKKDVFSGVGQLVVCHCQSTVDHGRLPLPIDVCSTCAFIWNKAMGEWFSTSRKKSQPMIWNNNQQSGINIKIQKCANLSPRLHNCAASEVEMWLLR